MPKIHFARCWHVKQNKRKMSALMFLLRLSSVFVCLLEPCYTGYWPACEIAREGGEWGMTEREREGGGGGGRQTDRQQTDRQTDRQMLPEDLD